MKNILLLFLLFIASHQLKAQTDERIKAKSDGFMEKSQKKRVQIRGLKLEKSQLDSNSLVVIDDKIYRGNAEELKKISLENLELVKSIKDSTSAAGIKYILIYKSKHN